MLHKSFSTRKKKLLLILIELELLAVLIIILFLLQRSLNAGNVEKFADASDTPVVTAEDGRLRYNRVIVKVPTEGASYAVGYEWAEDDIDYPSVPSSASAYYTNESGEQVSYEVLLYRDRIIDPKESSSVDDWYSKWAQQSANSSDQEAYKTSKTKGYLIRVNSSDDEEKTYCSYKYYFAVKSGKNVEQYVLELAFYDPDSIKDAENIFKSCAKSISIKKSKSASKKAASESASESEAGSGSESTSG